MKVLLSVFVAALSFLSFNASANTTNYGDISYEKAINISGKQRYLSQKLCKEALLSLKNGAALDANAQLMATELIFKRHHKLLVANATNEDIKMRLNDVEYAFNKLQKHIDKQDDTYGAEMVYVQSKTILRKCQSVVDEILKASIEDNSSIATSTAKREAIGHLINISGKQRLLSQKVSMLYIASSEGFLKKPVEVKEVLAAMQAFDDSLTELLISNYNDEKTLGALSTVMLKWSVLQDNKSKIENGTMDIATLNSDCDFFLDCFNKITAMYETQVAE